jgi:hypothetical protein
MAFPATGTARADNLSDVWTFARAHGRAGSLARRVSERERCGGEHERLDGPRRRDLLRGRQGGASQSIAGRRYRGLRAAADQRRHGQRHDRVQFDDGGRSTTRDCGHHRNFPKDASGRLLFLTFTADNSGRNTSSTFTAAQMAPVKTALDALVATISA